MKKKSFFKIELMRRKYKDKVVIVKNKKPLNNKFLLKKVGFLNITKTPKYNSFNSYKIARWLNRGALLNKKASNHLGDIGIYHKKKYK